MKTLILKCAVLFVNLLVAVLPFSAQAQSLCADVHTAKRGLPEVRVEWKDNRSYLEALQRKEVYGIVQTYFSKAWDTQVYYTGTGLPTKEGKAPLVDPNSKAVFIFFHGSGTMKSSGRNFIGNMNNLANLGYSAISFDYPFHAEGPRSPKFNDANYFMEWVKTIVVEARKAGKPVYLAGHSFGPDIILEFATRYPYLVDGVVALSPASFTKELDHWYNKYTTKMNFGGNVTPNDAGGFWAGGISKQFHWSKSKLADPTMINMKMRMRILSGDREEYVPAPLGGPNNTPIGPNTYDVKPILQKIFKNAIVTIEPGIGHYLFEHQDKDGYNVVMRELLAVAGEDMSRMKQIMEQVRAENQLWAANEKLALKYVQDPVFRAWADLAYGEGTILRMTRKQKDEMSRQILEAFSLAQKNRDAEIYAEILATKTTHPDFYEKYKSLIDAANPKKVDVSLFYPYLNHVLKSKEAEQP